jgi:hypothetical protein
MKYQCICCDYETDRSDNFTKHNDTKKHKINFEKYNPTNEQNNNEPNNEKDNSFSCKICLDTFNSRPTMYRHYKKCKENYEKKKIDELQNLQNTVSEIKLLLNEKLKDLTPQNIYNITNNNTTNNTTTNNNNVNNNVNNSVNTVNNVILSYVDTDDSHIENEDYKKIVNAVNFCVKMLVWKKHFNKDKPENMNLCISNKKDQYMRVYMKDKWISEKKDKMIGTLFEENEMQIEDWLNEYNDPQLNDKYSKYTKNKENDELKEELQEDLKQFIYDMTKELGIGKTK